MVKNNIDKEYIFDVLQKKRKEKGRKLDIIEVGLIEELPSVNKIREITQMNIGQIWNQIEGVEVEKSNYKVFTRQELIDEVSEKARKLERTPFLYELEGKSEVRRLFGTYNKLLKIIGLEPDGRSEKYEEPKCECGEYLDCVEYVSYKKVRTIGIKGTVLKGYKGKRFDNTIKQSLKCFECGNEYEIKFINNKVRRGSLRAGLNIDIVLSRNGEILNVGDFIRVSVNHLDLENQRMTTREIEGVISHIDIKCKDTDNQGIIKEIDYNIILEEKDGGIKTLTKDVVCEILETRTLK